jgi:hypothetical protein
MRKEEKRDGKRKQLKKTEEKERRTQETYVYESKERI